MYDAWSIAATGGGAAALTYLASGWKQMDRGGEKTLRLSLDKNHSLLGDVRLLGGLGTGLASMYVKGAGTKKALQVVSVASLLSLGMTEIVRWQLARQGVAGIAQKLPVFPALWQKAGDVNYGALPGPQSAPAYHREREAAWARR